MRVRRFRPSLILHLMLLGFAGLVAADGARSTETGDAGQGRILAETWCSQCHAVAPDARRRSGDVAPAFATLLAGRPAGQGDQQLRAWLHAPHPPMRGIDLSRQHIEDIVAYLRSLSSN